MSKALLIRELIDAALRAGSHEIPLAESLTTRGRRVALKPREAVTKVPARPSAVAKARDAGNAVVYMPVKQFQRLATPRANIAKPAPKPQALKPPGVTGPLAMLSDTGASDGLDIAEMMADLGMTHMPVELHRSGYLDLFGHGSSHDFDRFSVKKIGTGQGAQAYGQGLYAAEHPAVFADYRKDLGGPGWRSKVFLDDEPLDITGHSGGGRSSARLDGQNAIPAAYGLAEKYGDLDSAIYGQRAEGQQLLDEIADPKAFHERYPRLSASGLQNTLKIQEQAAMDYLDAADLLEKYGHRFRVEPPGRTYEIGLRAQPGEVLDWDRDLQDQPEVMARLQDALGQIGSGSRSAQIRDAIESNLAPDQKYVGGGEGLYYDLGEASGRGDVGASWLLEKFGFKGHKYLDERSRGRRDLDSPELTRNIVIYDDEPIDILDKYKRGGRVR